MMRGTSGRYGAIAVVLHWAMAVVMIGQLILGLVMMRTDDPAAQFDLFQWHKSFGFLILMMAIIRLVWMIMDRRPGAMAGRRIEQIAAKSVHGLLFLALLALPLSGWMVASVSPLAIPSYWFDLMVIPSLPVTRSDGGEAFWTLVHSWSAYGLAVLVAVHGLAAMWHQFILRDGLLRRMWF